MRDSTKGGHTTIIKRSSHKAHNGVHSGAWKVAFADFTLAMMALFMVLWIVGAVSEEERQEIVAQLNSRSIFEGSSFTMIDLDGKKPTGTGTTTHPIDADIDDETGAIEDRQVPMLAANNPSFDEVVERSQAEMIELSRTILKITSAYNAQANLQLEIVPQGLRILIQDDTNREMFQRSSALLSPFFNRLLKELAPVLKGLDNKLIITGHTDSSRYRDQRLYNNWSLSGDRAMAARRALMDGGLTEGHILQVNAMADKMLLTPNEPLGAGNRRIEIMVLTKTASDSLYQFFGNHGEKIIKPLSEKHTPNAASTEPVAQ